jgi:hypothetical protein
MGRSRRFFVLAHVRKATLPFEGAFAADEKIVQRRETAGLLPR